MSSVTFDLESLGILQDELYDIRGKWFNIGVQLGVDNGTLQSIRGEYSDNGDALREVLTYWLKRNVTPTLDSLLKALRSRPVGAASIADDLLKHVDTTMSPSDIHIPEGITKT